MKSKIQMHYSTDIAITSIAGRFPNADSSQDLWNAILGKRELISSYTNEELHHRGVDVDEGGLHYVPRGAYLQDPEAFDYSYFQMMPREVSKMDPQQRICLEVCHEALELSGYSSGADAGICSVFVGSRQSTWQTDISTQNHSPADTMLLFGGSSVDALATRVAYKLNCLGPAISVGTFCSGSLVAVHMACNSLLLGESDMALAGGVCVRYPAHVGYVYHAGGILSPTGRVRAFDEKADGTIFSDATAFVVLRRLEDALLNGEPILAVIKGSAINNDGAVKAGYSAPGVSGQEQVIRRALAAADVRAEQIGLIEAHGTGTPVGDGIELRALGRVFADVSARSCALGSIKSNLGHADCASGIAGLIKAIYAVNLGIIPPSMNCESPCAELRDPESPFYVPTESRDWDNDKAARIAGVSSFGIGGTNVHVIVAEPPAAKPDTPSSAAVHLIPLSARTETALAQKILDLVKYLEQNPETNIADVAFTLQRGRRHLPIRKAIVARDIHELISSLLDKALVVTPQLSELQEMYISPASVWQAGGSINWDIFYQSEYRKRLPLPTYPFERTAI
ncbi:MULTISPECIES: beta-ketoacyl synthase N-terminal-like domain-containing protein [Photorhabdus]|uniref:Beta-ketoacyl synthase N-terminal-like domain-containing protein n=1 Tax=Photorhabdus bodei TaxID=2029681 RepID=A0AAW6BPL5_9GAMM|nr:MULTISPECIES: beta-ketoacyl synthase N-terminal-like domain-containing protein [Photorhabdus]MCT8350880.1 polyketide synthase [Photorhabdus kayaii]MDB6374620.1 beta-ketoacyl synthase N-terminal-like domain-containing protein [Photorhabdus bodei]